MTSKQRVLCSLNWREPDRVPIQTYLRPEVEQALRDHFAGRDILECLGVDFREVQPVYRGMLRPPEEGIVFNMWGAGARTIGTYDEPAVFPLADLRSLDDVERHSWPDPDDFDYSHIAEQCDRLADFATLTGIPGMPDILNGTSRCRGMEQVLMDVALRDEIGLAIIEKRVAICLEILRRSLEAGRGKIDILQLGEDCGNQKGRMVSPRDFHEVFRPALERCIDLGHEFGCKVMLHSCGDTHELHPTFMEMGLDVLDAMQPEPAGMQPLEVLRDRARGKLAFCGLISTQQTLPHGSVADCRTEARHRLDVIAPGGGYIFAPAHRIQPDAPLENILAIYEEAAGRTLM